MIFKVEKEFNEKIINLLNEINIQIEQNQIEKFYKYMNLLIEWNKKINLTALIEENDIILKHYVDSLTALKYIENKKTIIDIGTGAGFPGIPISIMRNENDLTLVEYKNKKINFLHEVKNQRQIENINMIHSRAEDIGQDKKYRENFDYAISRAVANLSTLSEYLIPLVKIGGKIICMKGSETKTEIENAKNAIRQLGGKIAQIDEFNLPKTDMKRTIIIIEKLGETPTIYPRKAGIPSKNPIRV